MSSSRRRTGHVLSDAALGFVHPVEGDGNAAVHLCPGDLRQILGVEDEEICWSLGAGSRHDGQQHTCRARREIIVRQFLSWTA